MKQAIPWSVKGVDATARGAAKDAARRAGMTLGEWLNTVIVETAGERELRERRERGELDADDHYERHAYGRSDLAEAERLAELEARLERLAQEAQETALPRNVGRRAGAARPDAYADRNDLASVIERAMRDSQARSEAVEQKTAGALDAMVRWIERSDGRRREEMSSIAQAQERTSQALKEALGLVTSRMDSLERSLHSHRGEELDPVRAAIQRLESRIEALAERGPQGQRPGAATAVELEDRLADIAAKLAETESAGRRGGARARGQRISRIEQKLAAVLDALDGPGFAPSDQAGGDEPVPPAHTLDEAVAQIRAQQSRLEGVRQRQSEEHSQTAAILDGLRGDVISLSQKLDSMDSPRDLPSVDTMRRDIAELARAVQSIASRSDISALERSISALAARVEAWNDRGADDRILDPVQRVMDDMGRLVGELRPIASLSSLRDEIGGLAARLDHLPSHGVRAEVVETILSQIGELRAMVAKAARPISLEPLERQVAALSERLELALVKPARRGAPGGDSLDQLTRSIAEIRSGIDSLPDRGGFDRLERRIEELGHRVDGAAKGDRDRHDLDEIRSRIDDVQAAIQGRPGVDLTSIEARLDALGERLGGVAQSGGGAIAANEIHARLDALQASLDARPSSDAGSLESLVRSLGEKLDLVQSGAGDRQSLDGLERHISAMTGALERSGEGFAALAAMERSIGELFAKIEEAKLGAFEAAEDAARKAATQTAVLMGGNSGRPAGDEFADVRTRQTIEAVHETLEKIVERLGMLESDMASDRLRLANVVSKAGQTPVASPPSPTTAQKLAAAAAAAEAAKAFEIQVPRAAPVREAPVREAPLPETKAAAQPVMDLADNMLLEPGSGRPNIAGGEHAPAEKLQVEASGQAKASFIAAARKAAQAAAAGSPGSAFRMGRGADKANSQPAPKGSDTTTQPSDGESRIEQVRAYVDSKRRPLLIGLAAAVLAASSVQIARNYLATTDIPTAPQGSGIRPPAKETGAQSSLTAPPVQREVTNEAFSSAPTSRDPQKLAPVQDGKATTPPTTSFAPIAKDPQTVGSLGGSRSAVPPLSATDTKAPDAAPALPTIELPAGSWPKMLQKSASQNDPAALYELAARLNDGRGAARDPKLAAKWFERAAQQGHAPAQYRLGSLYEKGVGVAKDIAAAKSWYERAASSGNAKAMHNLGVLIADGTGGKPDYATAATLFRKAAELGVKDSQYNLAILTARGLGIQQNLSESWMWFSLAAAQGDQDAAKKRDEVGARMDAASLAAAKAALDAFKPKPQDPAANDVIAPAGGWDQETTSDQRPTKARQAKI